MHKLATVLSLAGAATLALAACGGNSNNNMPTSTAGTFKSTILVSDGSVAAPHVDPNLQNVGASRSVRPPPFGYRTTIHRSRRCMTATA